MAEIDLNPVFQGIRNKVGKMVFYRRNGETCMRTLGAAKKSSTPAQVMVRTAFSRLVETWRGLPGFIQAGWNALAKTSKKTGFNMFVGSNFRACYEGRAIALSQPAGGVAPVTLKAAPGASGEIRCEFTPAPLADGRHLVIFYQMNVDDNSDRPLAHIDFGENAASPQTITGLEPGAAYSVYAVVADRAYEEAAAVSESTGVIVSSGQ